METAQPVQATCFTAWQLSQEQPSLKSSLNTSCCNLCHIFPLPPTMHQCKMPESVSWIDIPLGMGWGGLLWSPLEAIFFLDWTSPAPASSHRTNAPAPYQLPGALLKSLQFICVFSHWVAQNWMQYLDAVLKRQMLAVSLLRQPRRLLSVRAARVPGWSMPTCPPGPQVVPGWVIHHTNRNQERLSLVLIDETVAPGASFPATTLSVWLKDLIVESCFKRERQGKSQVLPKNLEQNIFLNNFLIC